jgi:hypothetical protein
MNSGRPAVQHSAACVVYRLMLNQNRIPSRSIATVEPSRWNDKSAVPAFERQIAMAVGRIYSQSELGSQARCTFRGVSMPLSAERTKGTGKEDFAQCWRGGPDLPNVKEWNLPGKYPVQFMKIDRLQPCT